MSIVGPNLFEHVVVHFNHYETYSTPETLNTDPEFEVFVSDIHRLEAFIDRISSAISTTTLENVGDWARQEWSEDELNPVSELSKISLLKPRATLRHFYCNGINGLRLNPTFPPPQNPTTGESLYDDLRRRGKTHVVLNGYYLDGCVQTHAIDFKRAGFEAIIISDLTPRESNPQELFKHNDAFMDEGYEGGMSIPPFSTLVDIGIRIMRSERFLDMVLPLKALPQPEI